MAKQMGSRLIYGALAGAMGAAWRRSAGENAVDVLAHLVCGVATVLVGEELEAQPDRGPAPAAALRRPASADGEAVAR